MNLKHFAINKSRHQLVVDVAFYQMNLQYVVESARKADPELFVDDGQFLPSWSKFAKNPIKAKGFFVRMLQATFNGSHGHGELNFDLQRNTAEDSGVYMMFLPASMKVEKELKDAAEMARAALPNFKIVPLSGSYGVTNATAQSEAKNEIELARKNGKKVLILATCLAQRSFSVGEISAVFLAYDNGDAGATIQKISRGLTPSEIGKVGRIVSLSFDPRRDDKLDSLILQTAINYHKSHNLPSVKDALALVLKTVDIFNCTENGAIEIKVDKYLEEVVNQERISRVVGKMASIDNIDDTLRECILTSDFTRYIPKTDEITQKGKIGPKLNKKGDRRQKNGKSEDAILREKIIAICENLDVAVLGTNSKNMTEAIEVLQRDSGFQETFEQEFGMPYTALKQLVDSGAINKNLLDLVKY